MISYIQDYLQLEKKLSFSEKKRTDYQNKLLNQLVQHAKTCIPFYKKIYEGLDTSTLQKLPIISKQDIQTLKDHPQLSPSTPINTLQKFTTSGSTGEPFTTYFTQQEKILRDLFTLYIYKKNGLTPFHKRGYFCNACGKNEKPRLFQKFGLFRSYKTPLDAPIEEIYQTLVTNKIQSIEGFPSLLYLLSLENKKHQKLELKSIFSYGEALSTEHRYGIQKGFGVDPVNIYGMAEVGNIGFECSKKDGFHIHPDILVEILPKNGNKESGEIILTSLKQFTMPFIRYNTKDWGSLTYKPCKCGLKGPRIQKIEGRKSNFFVNKKGEMITTQLFVVGSHFLNEVRQFRVVQNEMGKVHITVSLYSHVNKKAFSKEFHDFFTRRFEGTFDYDLKIHSDININNGGKMYSVISNI